MKPILVRMGEKFQAIQFIFVALQVFSFLNFAAVDAAAQATTCGAATKFCAGAPVTFAAGTTGSAAAGPNYGCLGSQPAPAWFYFTVKDAGSINLLFNNSNSEDIDYAIWGPYADLSAALSDCSTLGPPVGGTTGAPVQCSFSGGATETASITGAANNVYIMLITNFSLNSTNITAAQTGGTGTLSCSGVSGVSAITIDDVTVTEGNSGTTNAVFTVTRSDNTNAATVDFATSNGTGTLADNDYQQRTTQTLNFSASGALTQTVTVVVNGDTNFEGDETFNVNLTNATGTGAFIDDATGVGTITNDDAATAAISATTNGAENGAGSTTSASFTVTLNRTNTTGSPISFNVAYSGTATGGSSSGSGHDYNNTTATVSVANGATTGTLTVPVFEDALSEGDETIIATISSPSNGAVSITTASATATLTDDDGEFLTSPSYTIWNGFLGQANVGALINRSTSNTATVTVSLLGYNGETLGTQSLSIPPHGEMDVLINNITGFNADSYGLVRIDFSPSQTIEGHMAFYRYVGNTTELDFSILKPMENSVTGTSYASFNTNYPRRDAVTRGVVYNWLQLYNQSQSTDQDFTVVRYDDTGAQISSVRVSIPAKGRRDVAVGHEDTTLNRYGVVAVVPDLSYEPYGGEIFRYGALTDGANGHEYAYAFGEPLNKGQTAAQYVSVARAENGDNFLEIENIDTVAETVNVDVWNSNTGQSVFQGSYTLAPKAARHLAVQNFLDDGEVGVAKVEGATGKRLRAKSSVYFYKPNNEDIAGAYQSVGRLPLVQFGSSVFNTFFSQNNWLKLFNAGSSSANITVELFGSNGTSLGSSVVALGAKRGFDVLPSTLDITTAADSYGEVRMDTSPSNVLISDVVRTKKSTDGTLDEGVILPVR